MNIGKFKVNLLDTGLFSLDGGAMFGVVPKTMWSKAYHPGDELNRIPLSARPLLVSWDDKIVLIDTGNGTKYSEKFQKIYNLDRENSDIEKALMKFGLKPIDINAVILTHLHFDHAGGATSKVNDEIIPTFSNAKYYVQKAQMDLALNPTEKDRVSFVTENFIPLKESGKLELLDGNGDIFPGISAFLSNGHTNAMQLIKISDNGETLFYCADMFPTTAHIPVPFVMGYDNNPIITIEEKKKILPQAYEEGWIMCFEHDAFIEAAKVISNEKGFAAGEKVKINVE